MKKGIFTGLLIGAFLFGIAGIASATPILNVANDGFEDYSDGSVFGTYVNTGDLMFLGSQYGLSNDLGNPSNRVAVEAAVRSWLTYEGEDITGFTLVNNTADTTITEQGSSSGTYTVGPSYPGGIEFYAIKAGNDFAMYYEVGGETYGSWSTYDAWAGGANSGSSLEISHFTGFNASAGGPAPVPEPATMLLFGTGLVGLAGLRMRQKQN